MEYKLNNKNGRNDPCHCGSGEKTNNCHGKINNKTTILYGMIVIILLIAIWFIFFAPSTQDKNSVSTTPFIPRSPITSTSPQEQAPTGKVWSPEHGHWHDKKPSTSIQPNPTLLKNPKPQPLGEAPAGKIWSPEHGHWHDKK
jgi:hypothetical protein